MDSDRDTQLRWLPPARDYQTAPDGRSTWDAPLPTPALLLPPVAYGPASLLGRMTRTPGQPPADET